MLGNGLRNHQAYLSNPTPTPEYAKQPSLDASVRIMDESPIQVTKYSSIKAHIDFPSFQIQREAF